MSDRAGSLSTRITKSLALAAALVGVSAVTASCSSKDAAVTDGCTSTADCALDTVCDLEQHACVPTPDSGVIGVFSCIGVDENGKGYPPTLRGTSQVMGFIDGIDQLSLVARAACVITDEHVILSVVDSTEATQTPADSYRLSVFVEKSAIRPGVPMPIVGAFVERYVDADEDYRDYAQSTAGTIIFNVVPTMGAQVPGYVHVSDLDRCDVKECFDLPAAIPYPDYPPGVDDVAGPEDEDDTPASDDDTGD